MLQIFFIVTKCRTVLHLHAFFSVFWVNITFIISMPKHSMYRRQMFSCIYKHKCIHVVLSQHRSMYALVADNSREATLHASLVLEIMGFLCLRNKQIAVTDHSCIVIPPVWLSDCKIVSTNYATIHIPADAFKFTLYMMMMTTAFI